MIKKILKKFCLKKLKICLQKNMKKNYFWKDKNYQFLTLKKNIINDFSEIEYRVYSQWGEDGIIDWIISRLKKIPKIFLEIGTEDYKVNQTLDIFFQKRNWDGFLIESDKNAVKKIKKNRIFWKYNINVINSFVNSSNINLLLKKIMFQKKLGY